ncbi:MAG: phosphoadenylyl-sulfate reductase [Gammaproteobacteria bacterium]|nr:phosphoadenylyl-sulfate reductase [Gammaproteobacteria bacterium]
MADETLPENFTGRSLQELNDSLESMQPLERIEWALAHLPSQQAMSSSFGIQSAVLLHMMTRVKPDMPVLLVDTGYLFPETYRFIEELRERLSLNLHVYCPRLTRAWQEARFGMLWQKGLEGLEQYNRLNKVEPMQQALEELHIGTWYAGLRREQSSTRSGLGVLQRQAGRFKVLPIIDWTNRDVHFYLKRHELPYHPLWYKGYQSVGDTHTSQPMVPGMLVEESRFMGLKRECGLHE